MKTAIIISGHIRTWMECKSNFVESFGHLEPDIFVSTYDVQYNYHPAQRDWMGGAEDIILDQTDIVKMFDGLPLKALDYEKLQDVISEYDATVSQLHPNFRNHPSTILQYRKLERAIDLIKNCQMSYDVIIKIRSDIRHKKFMHDVTEGTVVVSTKNVYPNDVILAAKYNDFMRFVNFISLEVRNPIYNDSHLRPPHNLIKRAADRCGLAITPIESMEYVVRKIGHHHYV